MYKQEHLTIEGNLTVLTRVQEWFNLFCRQNVSLVDWSEIQLYKLNLALTEGFTNAVRHAHEGLPSETQIDIELQLYFNRMEIRIWDQGQPFNPDILEEPMPGTLRQGGYGWFLLRRLTDRVIYHRCDDARNCLLIIKYCLPSSKSKVD